MGQYVAAYGENPTYAAVTKMITSAQGRRKYVDTIYRTYLHQPASNLGLFVGVSHLLKHQYTPEGEQASILSSYSVYEPWVEGCCGYYYPGYPIYDTKASATTSTGATASKTVGR